MTATPTPADGDDADVAYARVESPDLGGSRRIAYAEYGDPDGDPLLFLHGTPGSRLLGRLFDAAARDHGVRVLAPDRPGYGASDPWPDRTVDDTADLLPAVLDDAGVRSAGLVAFSGGAPYALAAATSHPERFTRIDVVSGAVPPAVEGETPPVQRLLRGLARSVPGLLSGLLRGQAWLAARLDPDAVVAQYTSDGVDDVPDRAAAVVRDDFLEALDGDAAATVTELRHIAEWEPDAEALPVTAQFRHGTRDGNVPIDGVRRFAERLPGATVEAAEDADHLGTLLRAVPDVVAAQRDAPSVRA